MLAIKLKFKGPLKKYSDHKEEIEFSPERWPCTILEILVRLNVPASAVSFVTVNEDKKGFDFTLQGGENIVIYPRVAGG